MKKALRTATLLAACGCFSLLASAGVVITSESGQPDGTQQKQKSVIYVDSGKIRMEIEGIVHVIMIFDGNKQMLWTISPDKGTYTEMSAADAPVASMDERRQQGLDNAMKKMQDQMANMPPEQRAQMEKMMKGMTDGASKATTPNMTYRSLGTTEQVGQFTCSKYEALNNGKRVAEHCTASFDEMHLSAEDLKTFEAMGKFMKMRMGSRASASPIVEEMKGFPVHTVSYIDKPNFETTVTGVEHKSVDSSLFVVPAGLKKQDPMAGRGGATPR
jgi:hypothetical protein